MRVKKCTMKIVKYEDLEIWQLSVVVTKEIYDIATKDQFFKDFGLRDQICRAAVSISSNIVEGYEKNNNNEFIRFLKIAKGSVGEVKNQLYIASKIKYLSEIEFSRMYSKLDILARKIGSLIYYLNNNRKNYLGFLKNRTTRQHA